MLSRGKLDTTQKYVFQLNITLKYYLICALFEEEIFKVHAMFFAEEMWDTFVLAYEGSKR